MMDALKRIEYAAKKSLGWCYYKWAIAQPIDFFVAPKPFPDVVVKWGNFYFNYPTFADWIAPQIFLDGSDKLFVKPCPFCGKQMDATDLEDVLHPMRDGYWQLSCIDVGGGCGVTMYGDSEKEVLAKWNQRT